jgi:putative FmdB family regulatory protein
MPIYMFECKCGNTFEKICKINDSEAAICPECGKVGQRMVCPSSFRLKGRGWEHDRYCGTEEAKGRN